jgi:hypothetical protein
MVAHGSQLVIANSAGYALVAFITEHTELAPLRLNSFLPSIDQEWVRNPFLTKG